VARRRLAAGGLFVGRPPPSPPSENPLARTPASAAAAEDGGRVDAVAGKVGVERDSFFLLSDSDCAASGKMGLGRRLSCRRSAVGYDVALEA